MSNHCGRLIQYPHFGAAQIAPPGVPVRISPCEQYYRTRNVSNISPDCWNCLYNEYSVVHPSGDNPKYTCGCDLRPNFTPANFCAFASCVENAHKRDGSCERAYNAIYNIDDVQDERFIQPFTFGALNCPR